MSKGEQKRASVAADTRVATLPPPSLRPVRPGPELHFAKPAKNPRDCIRHDAGSAVHSLHGFVELLSMGTFGPMTEAQLRSIHHLKGAAQRLFELIESSLELTPQGGPGHAPALSVTSLPRMVASIVHSSARERPGVSIELEPGEPELLAAIDPESFTRALNLLFDALLASGRSSFWLRVTRGRPEAWVDVTCEREETSISQSIPMQRIELTEVDQVSAGLSNRSYLLLKRCEALLVRQRGSLQLSGDLARLRVGLPGARE